MISVPGSFQVLMAIELAGDLTLKVAKLVPDPLSDGPFATSCLQT